MIARRSQLAVAEVSKSFGRGRRAIQALDATSFHVEAGEIVGVVGPNGAGKTTLLRLCAGELLPDAGAVRVAGHRASTRDARGRLGYAGDPPVLPVELTALTWLRYVASHRASSRRQQQRLFEWGAELTGLEQWLARPMRTLSRGATQRVALAASAIAGTHLLVLDELLHGVDPLAHRELRGLLAALARDGRAILIASHDLSTLERVATRALVISKGRLRADVRMADLLTERIAEVSVSPKTGSAVDRLIARFPGAVSTHHGVAVPLRRGATLEEILSTCRAERLAVGASRVRHRALEDLLADTQVRGADTNA